MTKILLVDDHEVIRQGLQTILKARKDWTVCGEAADGREAVSKALQLTPDVVVMDFSMPGLNGLDATRQIRKALPKTEVLMLTMHESEQLARECLAVGARGYVLKTDASHCLVAAIGHLMQHKPYFTPMVSKMVAGDFVSSGQPDREGVRLSGVRLTPREREIVQLVAEGKPNKEIADILGIRIKTVETHRSNIMHKLGLHSVSELVRYAIRNNMVQA